MNDRKRDCVTRASEAAQRLLRMIDEVLLFTMGDGVGLALRNSEPGAVRRLTRP
ncbi:MAG: hypothetical protein ABI205_10320 [Gemmatimonadaceae bacterium]